MEIGCELHRSQRCSFPEEELEAGRCRHRRAPGGCAYAIGTWDGARRIGFRWNGTDEYLPGNPQSRGLATWTTVSGRDCTRTEGETIFDQRLFEPAAANELVVGRHPSGRFTLEEREENHGTYRYLQDDAPFGNLDQQG